MTLKEILEPLAALTGLPAPTRPPAPLDSARGRRGRRRRRARDRPAAARLARERAHVHAPDVLRRRQGGARARAAADARRAAARARGRLVPRERVCPGAERGPVAIVAAIREELDALLARARDARSDAHGFLLGRLATSRSCSRRPGTAFGARRAGLAALCDAHRPGALVGIGVAGALTHDLVGLRRARRPPGPRRRRRGARRPTPAMASRARRDPGRARGHLRDRRAAPIVTRAGEGGARGGRGRRRRSRRRGHGVRRLGARGRRARDSLTRPPGRSPTAPTTSCPDIFPGAWTRKAASGGPRVALAALARARRRSRPCSPCARRVREAQRAPRRVRRALPRHGCLMTPTLEDASREDQPHLRAVDPRAARADAARGDDRLPALPHRRHLRGRRRTGRRRSASPRSPTSTRCCGLRPRARARRSREAGWSAASRTHAGYRELLAETPFVLDAFFALSPRRRRRRSASTSRRSADGHGLDRRAHARGGALTLHSIRGAPGLLLHRRRHRRRDAHRALPARPAARLAPIAALPARARGDLRRGAPARQHPQGLGRRREGRTPLPARGGSDRGGLRARAPRSRRRRRLRPRPPEGEAPRGIVDFTALPVRLAWATLDRVEARGPGAKVSRPEVFLLVQKLKRALDRGEPFASLQSDSTRR